MKLSLYTDNALKLLMYVAVRPEQRCTRVEVAEYFDLSVDHLRKVIHHLSQWGYLQTYSGRAGGFELGKEAKDINIGELIKKTENQKCLFDCLGQKCHLVPECALKVALSEAQHEFFAVLGRYSLADLIQAPAFRTLLMYK